MRFWRLDLTLALLALGLATGAAARTLDVNKPEDAWIAGRKVDCSMTDGKPTLFYWEGSMYSRVPGEKDRKLFKVQGMNVATCKTFNDAKRGPGLRRVSREVMFHIDPDTDQVVNQWKNPWTGETVDVLHVQNDPVSMREPRYMISATGEPYKFRGRLQGSRFLQGGEAPLFYTNVLSGDYQDYVGGTYQAMEMINFYIDKDELLDSNTNEAMDVHLSWARVSKWLPWMKMGDRAGMIITHTFGAKLASFDDLPEPMRSEVRNKYPLYLKPPPLDDTRPNETSWTFFKKAMDAKRPVAPAAR